MSQEVFERIPYPDIISMACHEALGLPMTSKDGELTFYPEGWLRFLGLTAEELLNDNATRRQN